MSIEEKICNSIFSL